MGKWDALKDKFKKAEIRGDTGFIEKVKAKKDEFKELSFGQLKDEFEAKKKEKDQIEDYISILNIDIAALGWLLQEQFEAQDITSVKTTTGVTLYVQTEPEAQVADREALMLHIENHPELKHLLGVVWQSLRALVKHQLEEGLDAEIPPGVKVYMRTDLRMRKS